MVNEDAALLNRPVTHMTPAALFSRRLHILHPRGVKFNSAAVAGDSPTNAELENGANWTRVFENKNVRIVAVDHNN